MRFLTPCFPCVWENPFDDCFLLSRGFPCSEWRCDPDLRGRDCCDCDIRLLCPYSPCKVGDGF